MLLLLPFLALLSLPFALAASVSADAAYEQLVQLAASNGGLIRLDDKSYNLLTPPDRHWTSAVHFTALDPRRRCAPCK